MTEWDVFWRFIIQLSIVVSLVIFFVFLSLELWAQFRKDRGRNG